MTDGSVNCSLLSGSGLNLELSLKGDDRWRRALFPLASTDLVFQFGDFYEDDVGDAVELNTYERMGLGNPIGDAMGILTSGDTSSRRNK